MIFPTNISNKHYFIIYSHFVNIIIKKLICRKFSAFNFNTGDLLLF